MKVKRKKKPRGQGDSFVLTLPLATKSSDERALGIRLEAARCVYNAVLGEALRRLDLMRQSKAWQRACKMRRGDARRDAFKQLREAFDFSDFSLQSFGTTCKKACWLDEHLMSHDTQMAATRAFRAVEQYAYGKRGRPRFRAFGRYRTIEGKANTVIAHQVLPDGTHLVKYGDLKIPMIVRDKDGLGYEARALDCKTKSVRLVRKVFKGRNLWYVQLVLCGRPPQRRKIGRGIVGLDLGPSELAAVSASDALLIRFCSTVIYLEKEIRLIRRQMDRSRRACNPHCFDDKGCWIRGQRITHYSKRYCLLRNRLAEKERCLAAERNRAHGELSNRILGQGRIIHTENISYLSFQRIYGRSVRRSGPSLFMKKLKDKAERAGGLVFEISTWDTRLSQVCHKTETYKKKPLWQRFHAFADGSRVQRDLYSAFLARFVVRDTSGRDRLSFSQARRVWARAEPRRRRAEAERQQSAGGLGSPCPAFLATEVTERIACKRRRVVSRPGMM